MLYASSQMVFELPDNNTPLHIIFLLCRNSSLISLHFRLAIHIVKKYAFVALCRLFGVWEGCYTAWAGLDATHHDVGCNGWPPVSTEKERERSDPERAAEGTMAPQISSGRGGPWWLALGSTPLCPLLHPTQHPPAGLLNGGAVSIWPTHQIVLPSR